MKTAAHKNSSRTEWLIPAGLVLLGLIPVAAGAVRIAQLSGGEAITPDNARFFASPIPVALHIFSVSVYSLLGAFQFAPSLRRSRPIWHRTAGRILIPSGFVAALTGLWMTLFYPWPLYDGAALYVTRLVVGFAMMGFLVLGVTAIQKRDFAQHGDWMTRAYAIGLGAGTQVFTHIPLIVNPDLRSELTRALCMGAGWVINVLVAEWMIQRRRLHRGHALRVPRLS
jgi:uncharacterized membrane protein